LVFLFENDFTVVYKPKKTRVVIDALSRLLNSTKPTYVPNQIIDASLFLHKDGVLNDLKEFKQIGQTKDILWVKQKQRLVKRAKLFKVKNGELYRMGQNNKL